MKPKVIVGLLLIVVGILSLVYGGFSYTQEEHDVKLGPLELEVKEKERINVPVWMGIAGIVAGALVLALDRR